MLLQCLFQVLVAVDLPLSDVTVKTAAHAKFVAVLSLVYATVAARSYQWEYIITTRILLGC